MVGRDSDIGERLHIRWLGKLAYAEAWDLQRRLFAGDKNHLLLLEHPPTFTMGVRAKAEHVLSDPVSVGAELHSVNRGGDVTFHGPGQVVGYPVLDVATKRGGGMADTAAYVASIEALLIEALAEFGIAGDRLRGEPGVWVYPPEGPPAKVAAIGVRLTRGRSMHGFALNVTTDLDWYSHIVPCGITDKPVTSMTKLGSDATVPQVVEVISRLAGQHLRPGHETSYRGVVHRVATSDIAPFTRGMGPGEAIKPERPRSAKGVAVSLGKRLDDAGVGDGMDLSAKKPEWMRVKFSTSAEFRSLQTVASDLDLVTVCAEAGCPNIYECWDAGTATFMLLGEQCTRACGFCLVDTSKPGAVDEGEPDRVAEAVERLGLEYAVLTMVTRDDLDDGGAGLVAATVRAIKARTPNTAVEVLISDLKGSSELLGVVLDAGPDVLNHNTETVPRLQRAVRPSAAYGRSLGLLARAKEAGFVTKSGLIVGMGETFGEVVDTLVDLSAVGVDIVTIGQYLRPTTHHLPVSRWWTPDEFAELALIGEDLGIGHVESSPLTRSSHHAAEALGALRVPAR